MGIIIDRRKNSKGKSLNNRQKFLKRVEGQIKEALPDILSKESIKDASSGGKVRVPVKGIHEPRFAHDPHSGNKDFVRPGNDRFSEGDRIPKPEGNGQGSGRGKGSNSPDITEDDFSVVLSRDEFIKYFFEDLELPNMVKKYMESTENFKLKRAGFIKYGVPSRLNVKNSFEQSLARQIALKGAYQEKINALEEAIKNTKKPEERDKLEATLADVKKRAKTIPFFDDVDLRYNNFEQVPQPTTSAVMFCIMDVSASMGYHEKDIAKRFFTLLYLFLMKQYRNVEIVFIRHHTIAKEVSEEEFFNSRESGGTVVAPSLELMHKIIQDRFPTDQWNIYCCQATDGDVWSDRDAIDCASILKRNIFPLIQYMAYIEINDHEMEGSLWQAYSNLEDELLFAMRNIYDVSQIWPVFKGLFRKSNMELA